MAANYAATKCPRTHPNMYSMSYFVDCEQGQPERSFEQKLILQKEAQLALSIGKAKLEHGVLLRSS